MESDSDSTINLNPGVDSRRNSVVSASIVTRGYKHDVSSNLNCFAPPGWCDCCPDPDSVQNQAKKGRKATELSIDKENLELFRGEQHSTERILATKKKLSLDKSKKNAKTTDRFDFLADDEPLNEATKSYCPKNTLANNKWAV